MKLKRLKLVNIRSYKDEEIIFPEGSILLSGDIGSGKTSILLAIEYALFGLQPGQRGSALLTNGKENGEVTLEFDIDEKQIIIERKLKRGSKTVSQDYASLSVDGEKVESSVTEIKTKILELLNYPPEFIKKNNLLYKYTVYTPQEEMKQIILEDSESRLNVLRHIFGIDKYKRIKENLDILTAKLREETRALQVDVRDLDESRDQLQSNRKFIEAIDEKITNKNVQLKDIIIQRLEAEKEAEGVRQKIKERENFMKEVEKTNIMLASKKDHLINEEKSIRELENKIAGQKEIFEESKLGEIIKKIKEKKNVIEDFNKNLIDLSGKVNSFLIKKKEDLQKKERIFKMEFCPTCLQNVSDGHKHNILNAAESSIKDIEKEEEKLKHEIIAAKNFIDKEKSELGQLEGEKSKLEILRIRTEEIKYAKDKLTNLVKSKETLAKDIEFLIVHIDTLKKSALEFTKYDNLIKLREDDLRTIVHKEKLAEIEIAEFRKELQMTLKEIAIMEKRVMEKEAINEKLMKTIDMEKWLSEDFLNLINFVEKNIMLTIRGEFTKLFNKWFSILTTDAFYVNLDENFTPIITQGDFELDYAYLSGGERTAVALAYRLALNQILNSMLSKIKTRGLIILDEPTDGFSDQQLDKLRDIFHELKVRQLVLVSHEQKIESFVDNIIRFKKEAGVSRRE